MKLTHRYDNDPELNEYLSHEYHCKLTKELNELAGFDKKTIDKDYVVDSYPENVQEYVQKYVGEKIEIGD